MYELIPKPMIMKLVKKLVLMAALAAPCMVSAQYADLYYHRHGDTIYGRPYNGFAWWWDFESFRENHLQIDIDAHVADLDSTIYYAYTPSPLKVVGIAVGLDWEGRDWVGRDQTDCELNIYKATPSDPQLVASIPLYGQTMPEPRILKVPLNGPGYRVESINCCMDMPHDGYVRMYEFYFDSSLSLCDSFYMGIIYGGNNFIAYQAFGTPAFMCNDDPSWTYISCGTENRTKFRDHFTDHSEWRVGYTPWWIAMYPIIEVDTTVPPEWYCPPLTGLQVTAVDSNTAVVTWDPFVNHTFVEVEYGPVDRSLGAQRVDTVIHTSLTLTGLNPSVPLYRLRARALCENAHEGDTPAWTRDIFFSTAAPDTSGIDGPRPLADHVSLAPNPASDEVEVHSPFGMRYIEVFDMKGMPVYSDYASHHRETLSLRGWRKGTYVMRITTPQGVLSKILVKQ